MYRILLLLRIIYLLHRLLILLLFVKNSFLIIDDVSVVYLLGMVVVDRLYWNELDAGTLGHNEAFEMMRQRLPERLHATARRIYDDWIVNIPEVEGMHALVTEIKEKYGVKCFVLSDISKYFAVNSHRIPILSLMDGYVYSANVGITKPDRRIFEHILRKFDLSADETVFVDDKPGNIEGAAAVGINGYVFDGDSAKLRAWLDREITASR